MRDNARKSGKSLEHWCICKCMPFLIGTVFVRTTLPCSGGYQLENGGIMLHDAVWINSKKGATTENQGPGVNYV